MRVTLILAMLAVLSHARPSTEAAQTTVRPAVFTAEQAEAGRGELQTNSFGACTDCHASTLAGRNGGPEELPPLSSLSPENQQLVKNHGGKVPALVGPAFLSRWASRTTRDLSTEFLGRFGSLSEKTRLNLIAYILQANGALPGTQPLTSTTEVQIRALVPVSNSK